MKNTLLICYLLFFTNLNAQQNNITTNTENGNNSDEGLIWHEDLKKAIPLSINSKKPILLFFTGSDWCGWCIRLQREVFAFEEFKKWSNDNVILVELDYPRRKQLAPNITKQNRELQQIFGVRGYPTVWLVNPQIIKSSDPENPADRINFLKLGTLGYVAGGPEKWINAANSFLVNK